MAAVMASLSKAESRRMYSWWWDSHISPKNSKWLKENLTDMDSKVKQMIKLIEEDADSFARRAEMYYKKRPELMKMVEEFYRAYRALAERYDHATGVIRHAHKTMAEVCPNQVYLMGSDEPPGSATEADPHTPEMPPPGRALFDSDELQGSGEGAGHAKFSEGKARKGLNFHDVGEEKERTIPIYGDQDLQAQPLPDPDRMGNAETEISNLKIALAKLESEKEAGLLRYEQSLKRLSNLESEVSRAQEDSRGLNERASEAETEVQNLKDALAKLQAEREAAFLRYQQYLEKISSLENSISSAQKDAGELNVRATKAEAEAESLKQDLARMGAEKEDALAQYKRCLEMLSKLEDNLAKTEEDARQTNKRADKAEREVETLKQEVTKLTEEKEAAALNYLQCLEKLTELEQKLSRVQEEARRLNSEIDDGVAKLKSAEERCLVLEKSNQNLQSELETLVHKVGSQGDELTEKQKELGRLWTCIQEERMRFVEAETAFQTLQHLHSQSQEELRSLVLQLQNRAEILEDMKTRNRGLEDEVQKAKEENTSLNELNLSSAVSIKNLQDEMLNLRETIKKLDAEVELRVDERNALQQEIYCLKEELKELSKKNRTMLEQVESVGFDPECFGSSVKELQDENSKLKQDCEINRNEKAALLEQLKIMEKLMEKNSLLENSLADLNVELEGVREKVKALEESCQSLLEEKSNLVAEKTSLTSQLHVTTENLEKLSEKNNFLENSLLDANAEIEVLRVKSKCLEDSCLLLDGEKTVLVTERESLASQLDNTQKRLENLGSRYAALEEKLSVLEKERETALGTVEELRVYLDAEKKERASFTQLSETHLAGKELYICKLQEDVLCGKKEFEEEQAKALNAQIEILVLLKCIQGLEEKGFSLLVEHQKLLEASEKTKKLISELEHESIERKVENRSLSEHNNLLKVGLGKLMKILDISSDHGCGNKVEHDQRILNNVLVKLQETQDSLFKSYDENQQLVIEKSVLVTILEQLQSEGANLTTERNSLQKEFGIQSEQLSALRLEKQKLWKTNEELRTKIVEGDQREDVLISASENLHKQLLELQGAYQNLQNEKCEVVEEKGSLAKIVSDLEEQKSCLEKDNHVMFDETIFYSNLSLVFNEIISQKLAGLEELSGKLNKLHLENIDLEEKSRLLEKKLEGLQRENLHLKECLDKSDSELHSVKAVNDQLNGKITDAKDLLSQKDSEIQMWVGQADAFFVELQSSNVREALLEGKINEITEAFMSLEDGSNSKSVEIELLKQKVGTLEDANGGLEAQLALYTSSVISLKNLISSLEKHTTMQGEPPKLDNEELEDTQLVIRHSDISGTNGVHTAVVPNGVLDLQDLERRIEAIQMAVEEKEKSVMLESIAASTKLDAAMREIEELKAIGRQYLENGQRSKRVTASREDERDGFNKNLRVRTKTHEISELGNEVLTKDIMLDQISSDCSSFGKSKRVNTESDNQMLELWETTDQDGSIDLKVGKTQKTAKSPKDHRRNDSVKAHKSRAPSIESLMEKELGVDKLEISRRSSESRQEGNKKRVLERLDSDAQKLSNLQITVQDLKRKVEITEKSKKGKGLEYESVKGQLEDAEEAITKLYDANRKLMKNCEDGSQSSDGTSANASDESGSVRRRRISEQARRGSEKIGRLQLEVQRLQFLLLKLDDDAKEARPRTTRITEHKTRVLLRDYLYGGGVRTGRKYKRAPFCSCVQPPTSGD